MVELAAAGGGPLKADRISQAQEIPVKFLENIMADLRHAGLVRSQRGIEGGYWLARPAEEINLAQVIRAVDGPLANVRGRRSEEVELLRHRRAAARGLGGRACQPRRVLEAVTLADVAARRAPARDRRAHRRPRRLAPALAILGVPPRMATGRSFASWA